MTTTIRFPNEADKIRREAETFRRLSPSERLRVLGGLMASGMKLLANSPHREAGRRLRLEQEAEWQRIQKELFARHAAGKH
jgi:hypothetical protein